MHVGSADGDHSDRDGGDDAKRGLPLVGKRMGAVVGEDAEGGSHVGVRCTRQFDRTHITGKKGWYQDRDLFSGADTHEVDCNFDAWANEAPITYRAGYAGVESKQMTEYRGFTGHT